MSIQNQVRAISGSSILISVGLVYLHSPHWLWLSALVGILYLQAAFTNFCPLEFLLSRVQSHGQPRDG